MSAKPKTTASRTTARTRTAERPPENIPGWLVPLVYALVVIVLFREFILGHGNLLGSDTLALGYFARNFYTQVVQGLHIFPKWDPLLYGGLPFVDGMHGDIFYPPSMALFFLNAASAWGWKMVLHVFLAGMFTYLWLRGLGLRRGPAFFGGLIYMMGADLVSLVFPGGDGKLFVSALAPLVFWLTERAVGGRRASDFALLALGIALVMFTSHMQLAYFTVWGISLYAMFRCWQFHRAGESNGAVARVFGMFALAGLLGVGASAVQFFPPLRYLREWSQRTEKTQAEKAQAYEYSATYSLHQEEIVSLVVPEFIGDNLPHLTGPETYWGRNPFKINHEYAGVIALLILPLLFLRRRNARSWFFLGLGTIALLYAVGATTPLFHLFYLIPGVKLFRAPSLIIFLFALSAATLGAFGLERYLDWADADADTQRVARRYLWGVTGAFVLLALLASTGVLTSLWQAIFYRGMPADRQQPLAANLPNIRSGFWFTTIFAALVAAIWEGLARRVYGRTIALTALSLLVFVDLYRVDRPFIEATVLIGDQPDVSLLFQPDDNIQFLQQRKAAGEKFRVVDLSPLMGQRGYPQNAFAIHGIDQLAGHHGNEMARARDLIGGELPTNIASSELRLLDVTNTTYVFSPAPLKLPPGYGEAFKGSTGIIYRNENVLPRAYIVGHTEVVPDADAVKRILSAEFDSHHSVVLPQALPAGVTVRADPQGNVRWLSDAVNEQSMLVSSDRPSLLVVLDNFYDAWHVTVDGKEQPLLRANYLYRAVAIGEGSHSVRFYYSSRTLNISVIVSAVILLLLIAVAASGLLRRTPSGTHAPANA